MSKAIVLGARRGSGNIGEEIAEHLNDVGWSAFGTSCEMDGGYVAPSIEEFQQWDADACIISLGAVYKDHVLDVLLNTFFNVLRANLEFPLRCALRYAQACGNGDEDDRPRRIVFIGSYAHRHPFSNGTAYCAAKAGLDMATKTLGWELTDRGFRVHIVHPYHVEGTPMWDQVQEGVMQSKGLTRLGADEYARKDLKMPDPLSPLDVARTVAWLLNDPAAQWTSGTSIELYGGTR